MPLSWHKLDEIERWTKVRGPGASPAWRVEAALQLAEGQLAYADRDSGQSVSQNVLAFRRDTAKRGFERVQGDSAASSAQISRARNGLRNLRLGETRSARPASMPVAPRIRPAGSLVERSAWGAAKIDAKEMHRAVTPWKWITVHHSAARSGGDSKATVRGIQRAHINNKWGDVGYHFLIDREGRVIEGRSLNWRGAHASGRANRGNVGICLLGHFDQEHPTPAALRSLDRLVYELQKKLRIPRPNVRPHSAWKATKCPGEHLMPWFTRRSGKLR